MIPSKDTQGAILSVGISQLAAKWPEVELLRRVVSVAKAGYGIEQKREYSPKAKGIGICDGFSQCLP